MLFFPVPVDANRMITVGAFLRNRGVRCVISLDSSQGLKETAPISAIDVDLHRVFSLWLQ